MKNILKLSLVVIGIMMMVSCTNNQQKKFAELRFCDNLNAFVEDLEALEIANEGTDFDAFNRAYNKTVRAWNRLENSAADLENLEINQAEEAYNKMENQIGKIVSDSKSADDTGQIASQTIIEIILFTKKIVTNDFPQPLKNSK